MARKIDLNINLKDYEIEAHVGVTEEERAEPQKLRISCCVEISRLYGVDNINDTFNYDGCVSFIEELTKRKDIQLLEMFAELIINFCMKGSGYGEVLGVKLVISKMRLTNPVVEVSYDVKKEQLLS